MEELKELKEVKVPKSSSLYEDQLDIHNKIVDYYLNMRTVPLDPETGNEIEDTRPWLKKLLIGYAGTGKTTTVAAIVDTIRNQHHGSVVISAPTHKAVRVLRNKSNIEGVEFATIQKVLGVKAKKNFNTGELEFEPDYESPFALNRDTLLVIDEVSMMNTHLFEYLVKSEFRFPVLFVGDSVQIPPVDTGKKDKLSDSAVFIESVRKKHLIEMHELTQVRRQAEGNPIIRLATYIRNNYQKQLPNTFLAEAVSKLNSPQHLSFSSATNGGGELDKQLITEWFTSQQYKDNPDYCRVVAWRNEKVRDYNNSIRTILYGEEAAFTPYVEGERIIFEEPYGIKEFGRTIIIAQNSEEATVVGVGSSTVRIEVPRLFGKDVGKHAQSVEVHRLKCITQDRKVIVINVPKDVEAYKAIIAEVQKSAKEAPKDARRELYKSMFAIQEAVAWINYGYAITAHKSQGSTYENTFVCLWDIAANWRTEERNRITYVAVTRSATKLHLSI